MAIGISALTYVRIGRGTKLHIASRKRLREGQGKTWCKLDLTDVRWTEFVGVRVADARVCEHCARTASLVLDLAGEIMSTD